MTPAGIEPATFPFVAQHLNHCATTVSKQISMFNAKYMATAVVQLVKALRYTRGSELITLAAYCT